MTPRPDAPSSTSPIGAWDIDASPPQGTLTSASRHIVGITTEHVLAAGRGRERMFSRAPNGASIAGFGAAAEIFGYGHGRVRDVAAQARTLFSGAVLDPHAPASAQPRLFGGFAFRDDFVPDEAWSAFHPAHFLLPHVQFTQDADSAGGWLTLSALAAPDDDIADTRHALYAALDAHTARISAQTPGTNHPRARTADVRFPMDLSAWTSLVDHALDEIHAGRIIKVVLARMCELRSSAEFDIAQVIADLNTEYPECYRFVFEPRPGHAFLGATPELLVRTQGRAMETMALAGSQARGATPDQDAALAAALLASEKDMREHRLVLDALLERLRESATALEPGQTDVMRLRNIQHLHTPLHATLQTPAAVLSAVETLHPTPALGGTPREEALGFLCEHEPVTRGWYAAPVGWFDAALDGEFCVAIRSAVVQNARAWLYAGCGIVAGSIPQREWDETGLKFRPMLRALGGSTPEVKTS